MFDIKKIFSPIRNLYHWCIGWADHPHGLKALCFFSFIESIFFPLPVDPLLVAMSVGQPKKSLHFALWTTIFSVLGALGGYLLGASLWDLVKGYIAQEGSQFAANFQMAQSAFQEHSLWTMVLAGFTFLPFKVFTVTAGVLGVSLAPFLIGCILGRSFRFFLIGGCIYKLGPRVRKIIEAHFEVATTLITLLIVLSFLSYKFFSH